MDQSAATKRRSLSSWDNIAYVESVTSIVQQVQSPGAGTDTNDDTASFDDPSMILLSSSSNETINKILNGMLVDLNTDERVKLLETLYLVRENVTNKKELKDEMELSLSDLKMARPFLDMGGLSLLLSIGVKWYRDANIVREWLRTVLYGITVALRIRYTLNDHLLTATLQLMVLSMKNYPHNCEIHIEAFLIAKCIFLYVYHMYNPRRAFVETLRFLYLEVAGNDVGTRKGYLYYVLEDLKKFPENQQLKYGVCVFLKVIILNASTFQLPDRYSQRMVILGIPAALSQLVSSSLPNDKVQEHALTCLTN